MIGRRVGAVGAIAFAILVLQGCASASPDPLPTTPAVVACPDQTASLALLEAFVRDYNEGSPNLRTTYFTAPEGFSVWWDPTVPDGETVSYDELEAHWRELLEGGRRLGSVQGLRTVEDADEAGVAFVVDGGSHGKIDCETGRLTSLVLTAEGLDSI
jgi:hypothetical protein